LLELNKRHFTAHHIGVTSVFGQAAGSPKQRTSRLPAKGNSFKLSELENAYVLQKNSNISPQSLMKWLKSGIKSGMRQKLSKRICSRKNNNISYFILLV